MAGFIGEYTCKVDSKSRIMFPAAFKKQQGNAEVGNRDAFVIKKDIFENCLILYTMDEWNTQVEIIRAKINPYNKEHNQFLRSFYRGMAEIELDNANRMLIPKRLLDEIGVQSDVVMAGIDGKIEIWAKEIYENQNQNEDDFAALAEKILGNNL